MLVNVFSVKGTQGQTSTEVTNNLAYFEMHKMNPNVSYSFHWCNYIQL